MTDRATLLALANRVEAATCADNGLDVLVEVALFSPSENCLAVRPNSAGTKVIYSYVDGTESTYRAEDWTMDRAATVSALHARAEASHD